MATSQKQLDNLTNARAAKALKASIEPHLKPEIYRTETSSNTITTRGGAGGGGGGGPVQPRIRGPLSDEEVWLAAFTAAMSTLEIKSPVILDKCVPVADQAVLLFNLRFPK